MRRGVFFKIILLFFLILLQSTRFNIFSIYGVRPDFIMLFVCMIGLYNGSIEGTIFGFVGGILQDLLSIGLFGAVAFSKTLCGYFIGKTTKRLDTRAMPVQVMLVFFFSILNALTILFFHYIFDYSCYLDARSFLTVLGQALYNSFLWPFFIYIVFRLMKRMHIE